MGERRSVLSRYVVKNEFQMCLKVKDVQPHRGKKRPIHSPHSALLHFNFSFFKGHKGPKALHFIFMCEGYCGRPKAFEATAV